MKRAIVLIAAGLAVVTAMLAALYLYTARNVHSIRQQQTGVDQYDRHYCLISMDHSTFWQQVCDSAAAAARENEVYLEWIGQDSPVEYTLQDCIRIAIASGVDGIILSPGGKGDEADIVSLVNRAAQAGIPVVTVISDAPDSDRISYVGINNIQMGELYASCILPTLHAGLNRICLLADTDSDSTNVNLVYSQLLQVLEQGKGDGQQIELTVEPIDTMTGFDAEEEIRDIFVAREELPDTLVCMDLTATESIAQALVDYNRVGSVNVVGTFTSPTVTEAVTKGILSATVDVNVTEVGKLCVSVLNEYISLGYANNYLNIPLELVDQQNAARFAQKESSDEDRSTSAEPAETGAQDEARSASAEAETDDAGAGRGGGS